MPENHAAADPSFIDELKEIGADIVPLAGADTAAEARGATGGAVVRLALDGVGGDATGTLLDIVGWEAKIVCYAAPTRPPINVNQLALVFKRASIHPFFMYYPEYLPKIPEKIRAAAKLVASHQLRAPIAAVYPAALRAGSCPCLDGRQSAARFRGWKLILEPHLFGSFTSDLTLAGLAGRAKLIASVPGAHP